MNEYERSTILRIAASLEGESHIAPAIADQIRRLRSLAGPAPEPKPAPPTFSTATMDDLDRRIAELEASVRRTAHQINTAREAMAMCSSNDRLHASVRHIADALAINLGAEPPAPDPWIGKRVRIKGDGDWRGKVVGRDGNFPNMVKVAVDGDDDAVAFVDEPLLAKEDAADV